MLFSSVVDLLYQNPFHCFSPSWRYIWQWIVSDPWCDLRIILQKHLILTTFCNPFIFPNYLFFFIFFSVLMSHLYLHFHKTSITSSPLTPLASFWILSRPQLYSLVFVFWVLSLWVPFFIPKSPFPNINSAPASRSVSWI